MQGLATRLALTRQLARMRPVFHGRDLIDRLWCRLRPARKTSYEGVGEEAYIPNIHGPMALGTPAETRKSKRIRGLNLARTFGIVVVALGIGILIGHDNSPGRPSYTERIETLRSLPMRQAVLLLPSEKRKCAYDWHEGCTVCTHVTTIGNVIQTSMC